MVTGAAAFALRLVWPVGINVWGLQLGYFASYIVLFGAGILAVNGHWLERLPKRQVRFWWYLTLLTLPTLPLAVLLSGASPKSQSSLLSVAYAFWEPFVAWGMILFLIRRFQMHFQTLAGLWRPLARRAYTIYIVHPPVLVAVALAWRDVPANALIKFAVTGTASCVLCYVLAGMLVRLPGLRSIL